MHQPDFEGYRNNAKKEFEENWNYMGEEFHQDQGHPMKNRDKQDGIRSWCQLVKRYETDGNTNFKIKI
jgi:hypothetical protein